jgi:hypothetical protein
MKSLESFATFVAITAFAARGMAQTQAPGQNPGEPEPARIDHVQSETLSMFAWTVNTERALEAQHGSPCMADLPRVINQAQSAHTNKLAELDELIEKRAELLAAVDADTRTNADINKTISEWKAKLAAARSQLKDLSKKEAELMQRLSNNSRENGVTSGVGAGDRTPIVVMISHNLVAPLQTPYFQGQYVRFTDGTTGVEITAKQEGIPLGQALQSGEWLASALDAGDTRSNFVTAVVAPDSINTYYALVKEVRNRKYLHTWGPWDGASLVLGGQSGNSGGVTVW